jgi:hypothetical protein
MAGVVINPQKIRVLGVSGVAVSAGANTTENTLATITIPAGAMGPNGQLRIYTLWNYTNSANNKTFRVRLGGAAGTQALAITHTTSTQFADMRIIQNAGVENSQIFFDRGSTPHPGSTSAGANTTAAIDTAAGTTLVITGQKATAGEVLTLVSYSVELITP